MTVMSQKDLILNRKTGHGLQPCGNVWPQSFRLMVGVRIYQTYVEHMRKHHPDMEPMDPKTFYRHCVDSRYPSAGSGMKKCPC